MRFKRGDKVLAMGNAKGMSLNITWPLKAIVYSLGKDDSDTLGEHYNITFDVQNNSRLSKELERQGLNPGMRWLYPVHMLRRDKFCPVCNITVETYSDRNLIGEHGSNNILCYGSHSPLEL